MSRKLEGHSTNVCVCRRRRQQFKLTNLFLSPHLSLAWLDSSSGDVWRQNEEVCFQRWARFRKEEGRIVLWHFLYKRAYRGHVKYTDVFTVSCCFLYVYPLEIFLSPLHVPLYSEFSTCLRYSCSIAGIHFYESGRRRRNSARHPFPTQVLTSGSHFLQSTCECSSAAN